MRDQDKDDRPSTSGTDEALKIIQEVEAGRGQREPQTPVTTPADVRNTNTSPAVVAAISDAVSETHEIGVDDHQARTSSVIRTEEILGFTEPQFRQKSDVSSRIMIVGNATYHGQVKNALKKIMLGKQGRRLIEDFEKWPDKTVWIRNLNGGEDSATPFLTKEQEKGYKVQPTENKFNPLPPSYSKASNDVAARIARRKWYGAKGEGVNTEIIWRPNDALDLNAKGRPLGLKTDPSRSYLALAHELIHARGLARGTFVGGTGDRHKIWTLNGREEQRTTHGGLFKGVFNRKGISENSIRKEQNAQARTTYNVVKGPKEKPVKELSKQRAKQRGMGGLSI